MSTARVIKDKKKSVKMMSLVWLAPISTLTESTKCEKMSTLKTYKPFAVVEAEPWSMIWNHFYPI